jgi:serine/threonine protein kinase
MEWYLSKPWTHPFASNALGVDTKAILGRGSFGVVYKAKFLGEEVAAKTTFAFLSPDLYQLDDQENLQGVVREVVIELGTLSLLNHPNVVRFRGLFWDNFELPQGTFKIPKWIVMNLIEGTSLEKLLKSRNKKLPVEPIAKQLCEVLCYFRKIGFVHRDLKPANIMFDERTNKLTVTDFGIARPFFEKTVRATLVGTPLYVAPEVVSGNYGPSVDVYSFGVVLLEVFLNETPELDLNKRNAQVSRVRSQDASLGALLECCLSQNSQTRPHPEEIRKYLNQVYRN